LAAAVTVVAMWVAPSAAQAAIAVTATGDNGQPAALNTATPIALRNMDVQVDARVDTSEGGYWSMVLLDPTNGPPTAAMTCYSTDILPEDKEFVDYRGNGTYTVVLRFYPASDRSSATTPREVRFAYTVNAFVALVQPPARELTRQPGTFVTNDHLLDYNPNPGAFGYDILNAKNAALAPDGSISGPSSTGYIDTATGKVKLGLATTPGVYTVVTRAYRNGYYTAWSPPVYLKLIAPFDFSYHSIPDSIGPSYKVAATLGEKSTRGKVTISLAKGKKGKHFHRLGRPKISRKGTISLRFKIRKRGWYRIRYSFHGSATTARGTIYQVVRIKRVLR
jgi:hypothetical protein